MSTDTANNCSMMNVLEAFGVAKSAVLSITSALTGTLFSSLANIGVDTGLQRLAWTVAILAGIVSIVNGIRSICKKTSNGKG